MCLLRVVVQKTCGTRQSVLHCLPNWAVLCGQRSYCFHEPYQFWSAPTESLSRVFRFYLALSGMMPAYWCRPNHLLDSSVAPKIIYWTAYGCIKFYNLVASNCIHISRTTVKSCFETILLKNLQEQHFQESFIIDKLFITFGGRTVISALIVW